MPYKDTFDHKGPLTYILNFLGLKINPDFGVWVVELVAILATFLFMYMTARLLCSRLTSLLILLFSSSFLFQYFWGGNFTEEYALPFISIAIYIFTDYFVNKKISVPRLVVCGLSFAAVCFLRINMVAIWAVMSLGVLIQLIRDRSISTIPRYIGFFLLGSLILLIPIMFWLWLGAAVKEFIYDYLFFNARYSSAETELEQRIEAFLYFGSDVGAMLALCASIYWANRDKCEYNVLYFMYMLVNILLVCMSGRTYMHYGMVLVPSYVYPLALCCRNLGASSSDFRAKRAVAICLVVILCLPTWHSAILDGLQEYRTRQDIKTDPLATQVAQIVQEYSSESDGILVCGNWDLIYNLSERFASTKYSYQYPTLSIDKRLAKDYYHEIGANPPKLIVFRDDSWVSWNREHMLSFIKKKGYTSIGTVDNSNVMVYVRQQ